MLHHRSHPMVNDKGNSTTFFPALPWSGGAVKLPQWGNPWGRNREGNRIALPLSLYCTFFLDAALRTSCRHTCKIVQTNEPIIDLLRNKLWRIYY